jgi:hypothetical protein
LQEAAHGVLLVLQYLLAGYRKTQSSMACVVCHNQQLHTARYDALEWFGCNAMTLIRDVLYLPGVFTQAA